jgi:hypothetical protein
MPQLVAALVPAVLFALEMAAVTHRAVEPRLQWSTHRVLVLVSVHVLATQFLKGLLVFSAMALLWPVEMSVLVWLLKLITMVQPVFAQAMKRLRLQLAMPKTKISIATLALVSLRSLVRRHQVRKHVTLSTAPFECKLVQRKQKVPSGGHV